MADLEAIRARWAAAPAGPWNTHHFPSQEMPEPGLALWRDGLYEIESHPNGADRLGREIAIVNGSVADAEAIAAFIAHSREDVRDLLALLDAAKAETYVRTP